MRMLIYDGECAFCARSARWVAHRLPADADARIVAWQELDDLGAYGLTERDVTTAAYWVDEAGRTHRGHRAIARSLRAIGGDWKVAGLAMAIPPVSWLAAAVYWWVARNRNRMPGGSRECKVRE